MPKKRTRLWLLLLIGALLVVGCQTEGGQTANKGQQETLIIGAAASLNEAFTEIGEIFMQENPDWRVEFTFASSGNLMTSIQQGAPIDVFASAAEKQMAELVAGGHIEQGTVQELVKNEIVLIVPQTSEVRSLEAILSLEKLAIGEPESVPAGQYTKQSLINLGYWEALEDKLIFAKDVRQALFYVERGEVDAGFVYATDAAKSDVIQIVTAMAPDSYPVPLYPIGMVRETTKQEGALLWIDLVTGAQGQEVLAKYGFKQP